MRHMRREIEKWLREMSRTTRFGALVLVIGAVIDLIYHALIEPFFPLPGTQETLVAYAGHLITFAGMMIMLLSVAWEAWQQSRATRRVAPPDSISMRRR